jgi:hypothetical protein
VTDNRRLIPVVRKASPVAKPHPTVSNVTRGIPSCPIRKLSQDSVASSNIIGNLSCSESAAGRKNTTNKLGMNKNGGTDHAASKTAPSTLSRTLELPLYDPFKNKRSTDSTVSSASSAGNGSRPPLPPKKRTKNHKSNVGSGSAYSPFRPITSGYKKKMSMKKVVVNPKKHPNKEMLSSLMAQAQLTTNQTTPPSQSQASSSPRSITDYVGRPSGRRSLSKTLMGADQAETAPVLPTRKPSTEPDQHNLVDPTLNRSKRPGHFTGQNLFSRSHSSLSASSSSSSVFSDTASQSSSNSDTIATYPSFCSSHASEVTIQLRNGQSADEIMEVAAPFVAARSLSFLPTPLEQVSERSVSDRSESTAASPPLIQKKTSNAAAAAAEDIVFQPPVAPLPVDHSWNTERRGQHSGTKTKGRFFRMLRKFY